MMGAFAVIFPRRRIAATVKGFTDGTDAIRTSLKFLKDSAGGSVIGDLDTDLSQLDAIDADVEQILKKSRTAISATMKPRASNS